MELDLISNEVAKQKQKQMLS